MLKFGSFIRILPMIVIIFLIVSLMGKGDLPDIARFLLSLAVYSLGFFLIFLSLTGWRPFSKHKEKKEK